MQKKKRKSQQPKHLWIAMLLFPLLFTVNYIFTWNSDIIQLFVLQEVPATRKLLPRGRTLRKTSNSFQLNPPGEEI